MHLLIQLWTLSIIELCRSKAAAAEFCFLEWEVGEKKLVGCFKWLLISLGVKVGQGNTHTYTHTHAHAHPHTPHAQIHKGPGCLFHKEFQV